VYCRDWGRDCYCEPGKDDTCGKRFDRQLGTLPEGYDHKFICRLLLRECTDENIMACKESYRTGLFVFQTKQWDSLCSSHVGMVSEA